MYDIAKKARSGMKAKAERLAGEKDRKTDSSDWSPAEPLNADVKTGMRPVSRRAYKKGGAVKGEVGKQRADRAPRKTGGSVETKGEQPLVDRYINRDLKKANDYRDGTKHVGALKHGGRAKRSLGGDTPKEDSPAKQGMKLQPVYSAKNVSDMMDAKSDNSFKMPSKVPLPPQRKENFKKDTDLNTQSYKKGGRAKKADGGPMQMDPRLGIVNPKMLQFGSNEVTPGLKKGGRVKKEVGGPARAAGAAAMPSLAPVNVTSAAPNVPSVGSGLLPPSTASYTKAPTYDPDKYGASSAAGSLLDKIKGSKGKRGQTVTEVRPAKAYGGALAMGGKAKSKSAKGKTNINIIIATGKPSKTEETPMAPIGAGAPPAVPPAAMMGAGAPPPMGGPAIPPMGPPPAPAGMQKPPMPPPMPRKAGGRVSKVARSFKDMTAGAGSGEGRLQKTDIAKRAPHKHGGRAKKAEGGGSGANDPSHTYQIGVSSGKEKKNLDVSGSGDFNENLNRWLKTAKKAGWDLESVKHTGTSYPGTSSGLMKRGGRANHKAGGKVYRSYKDMDAGAGSGEGRLEKSEIQSRKK